MDRRFHHSPKAGAPLTFDIDKRIKELGGGYKPLDYWRTETHTATTPVSLDSDPTRLVERPVDPEVPPLAVPRGATRQLCSSCQNEEFVAVDDYICVVCRAATE